MPRLGIDPFDPDPYKRKIYNRRDIRDITYSILIWIITFVSFIGAIALLAFVIMPEIHGTWIDTGGENTAPKTNDETGYMIYESEQDEFYDTLGSIIFFPFAVAVAIPMRLLFKYIIFPGIEYLFRKYEDKKIEGR